MEGVVAVYAGAAIGMAAVKISGWRDAKYQVPDRKNRQKVIRIHRLSVIVALMRMSDSQILHQQNFFLNKIIQLQGAMMGLFGEIFQSRGQMPFIHHRRAQE